MTWGKIFISREWKKRKASGKDKHIQNMLESAQDFLLSPMFGAFSWKNKTICFCCCYFMETISRLLWTLSVPYVRTCPVTVFRGHCLHSFTSNKNWTWHVMPTFFCCFIVCLRLNGKHKVKRSRIIENEASIIKIDMFAKSRSSMDKKPPKEYIYIVFHNVPNSCACAHYDTWSAFYLQVNGLLIFFVLNSLGWN